MRAGRGAAAGRLLLLCFVVGLGVAACQMAPAEPKRRIASYGRLHRSDVPLAWMSLQETLETRPSEKTGSWRNDSTGSFGSVTPLRTYRIATGTYCRDYREVVAPRGRAPIVRTGTACRDRAGVWRPVER